MISLPVYRRLSFLITAPIIGFMAFLGVSLFIVFHDTATNFVDKIVTANMAERATDLYELMDRSLDELLQEGKSADEQEVVIKKAWTLSRIEDALRETGLGGAVFQEGQPLLGNEKSLDILKAVPFGTRESTIISVDRREHRYYVYHFSFEIWKWHIYLIKDEKEYGDLFDKVLIANIVASLLFLAVSILAIYSLEKFLRKPLLGIVESVKRGEPPHYRGIEELTSLSDNIGQILDSLQIESRRINSIFEIALTRRGKDFYTDVAAATGQMLDLNCMISKMDPGHVTNTILALQVDGESRGALKSYGLQGSPCEALAQGQDLVMCEKEVRLRYPYATVLTKTGAESYAGVPIRNRNRESVGVVAVFGKARSFVEADLKMLRAVAQVVAAEFELQERAVYLENILRASTDTAIVACDLDYRITYCNPLAERLLDQEQRQVVGRYLTDIPFPDTETKGSIRKGLEDARATGEHACTFEKVIDDRGRSFDARIYAMRDENRLVSGYVLIGRDVTDYKRLEEQLLHSQKLEAVGLLAGGVAHEFNNILMAIMGYADLLKQRVRDNSELAGYLSAILSSSDKAANLTRGLLAFSRKQMISLQVVDLNTVIKRIENLIVRAIGEEVDLRTILAADPLPVNADSGQIEQVLINLANNARDAMPTGGTLTLETRMVHLEAGQFAEADREFRPGDYALISVSDTGIGMDEETKKHIFEPFFTVKEIGKGTGLGLSVVFGIIRQHNGYIYVYSEPGRGTTFKICLPISAEVPIPPPEADETEPLRAPGGSETILFAEDNVHVRNLLEDILTRAGYKVLYADSWDAVRIFQENADDIALLLLDVVMPRKSGKEVYDDIRALRPDIRAVFMSGYTSESIQRRGFFEEGLDFVSKPISPFDLLTKIREVLDRPSR